VPTGLSWLDVGCGTGSFTPPIKDRCASIGAVDPSADQIAYARSRPAGGNIAFQEGDALALPFDDATFDVAVAALVIFFLPDRVKGAAEMKRVAKPGGTVATYMWDGPGRRLSMQPLYDALESMEVEIARPPGFDDSTRDRLAHVFEAARLEDLDTCAIDIELSFDDFDAYFTSQTILSSHPVLRSVHAMSKDDVERLKGLAARQTAAGPGRSSSFPPAKQPNDYNISPSSSPH
jgi:SAM-dependent methyltransferase